MDDLGVPLFLETPIWFTGVALHGGWFSTKFLRCLKKSNLFLYVKTHRIHAVGNIDLRICHKNVGK